MKRVVLALALFLTGLIPLGTDAQQASPPAKIVSFWMSQHSASAGDYVHGWVKTSPSTASIELRIAGYGTSLKKVDLTTFVGGFQVPQLPNILKRTWTVRMIARTIDGTITDERDTSLAIH